MPFSKDDRATEGSFTNENGFKIFCKYWSRSLDSPKGLLFMCHGAAEHCLYYGQLAEMMTNNGFFVFANDHQGMGQSEGPRVHIDNFRHYTRDMFTHIDMVKKEYPDLPVFILGHSMGGAVTTIAALDRPNYFTGVVLIGPTLTPDQDSVGPIRVFIGKIVAKLLPQCPLLWLKNEDLSRDKTVCQKYQEDPLNYHGGLKAKWGLGMLETLQEIEKRMPEIKWPFLVIHGSKDPIVSVRNAEDLYKRANSSDKKMELYPDCLHQVHNELEPDGSHCRDLIQKWLVQRLS